MMFVPAYRKMTRSELLGRVDAAVALLKSCSLCARNCSIDRTSGDAAGDTGFCKTGSMPSVASWGPHFGEERPLVGRFGSGTVFFNNCNLGCIFCQNWDISQTCKGATMSVKRLAAILLELQDSGCHNINLVSPTHQAPMILQSLSIAIDKGLSIPIVYNSGGYDSVGLLELLDGIIDIYMPDFKYADEAAALKYSGVKDYPSKAKAALREMHRQVGDLIIDERGIAVRGLIVRHLVLPEGLAGTQEVMRFIAEELSRNTYVNIMDQYYPSYRAQQYPPLDRRITKKEYDAAIQMALDAGLTRIDGHFKM